MTIDEFLALPEEQPWKEFVRGEVMEKPMPTNLHGELGGELVVELGIYLRASGEGAVGFETRYADRDRDWVYLPDVHVRLFRDQASAPQAHGPVETPPDFAIEILSADDRPARWRERVALYMASGTQLLWVIDPEEERIHVYRPGQPPRTLDRDTIAHADPVLAGFSLNLGAFFDRVKRRA